MGKTLIGYATGDIHFNDWKTFNTQEERTQVTIRFLSHLMIQAKNNSVPIFHTGDLYHTPKGLTTKTLSMFANFMETAIETYPGAIIYGISGNHDLDQGYSLWDATCKAYPKMFINIDNGVRRFKGFDLYGIPYKKRNEGLVKQIDFIANEPGEKILLLHTALYGAPDPSGYELEPENLPRNLLALFKDFELVLAGHVHKYTQVENNVIMVGAPNQQRKSDSECEMGYLEIYNDFSTKFIKFAAPRFRYYNEGEEHENTWDFWIEIKKPKKLKKGSEAAFKPTMNREQMARQYAEETGITSPRKIKALINILNQTDD